MDFEKNETDIKAFLKQAFEAELTERQAALPGEYVSDAVDLDQHKKSVTVFENFSDYQFEQLSNESRTVNYKLTIYIVLRNKKPGELHTDMLRYATAFYKTAAENSTLAGLVDFASIDTVTFYETAEANEAIKVAELEMTLKQED
jgi:hypothetical protein